VKFLVLGTLVLWLLVSLIAFFRKGD